MQVSEIGQAANLPSGEIHTTLSPLIAAFIDACQSRSRFFALVSLLKRLDSFTVLQIVFKRETEGMLAIYRCEKICLQVFVMLLMIVTMVVVMAVVVVVVVVMMVLMLVIVVVVIMPMTMMLFRRKSASWSSLLTLISC